ncbi:MAG TPA: glycosyl transferase, partial [Methylomirabilota bacterium]|nr:glycosyl transferase [Methylomirabilota bacterium]
NRLLRGAADTTFLPSPSPPPEGVRYVITLDADTHLPRGAAARLVGTLAHPLNRARLDPYEHRVVEGYGILQPRIAPTLPTDREGSIYQRISSGPAGIDPYASAVSDVYQDLFGEGSYTGKGIYDIDAFERALAGRVPEGALLSHDLFEGLFARAGLVSDIDLFEEFPARYEVAAARQHRWARGDWQLLPWILRGSAGEGAARGPIDTIGQWKMFDNLRRTLSAPATYLTLLLGWTLSDGVALVWTKFVLLAIAIPAFIPVSTEILPQRPGISKRAYLRSLAGSLMLAVAQVTLTFVLLAHQAWLMADAVGRTLTRLVFTRRRLLEWVSAAQVKSSSTLDLGSVYARMSGALVLALVAGVVAMLAPGAHWILAVPLVTFWFLSPAVARWISLPPRARPAEQLAPDERETLRTTARGSWRFFETFVTAADNALPPDNFQEEPRPVVARRSSPTNIGLYLLSTASARDFGWIGTLDMADRLEATLATLDRLERFRGHFYNWYDTGDLRPLEPRYVSTVDSGNFAGHLCVLGVAAREWTARPFVDAEAARGVVDALRLVRDAASLTPHAASDRLRAASERLIDGLAGPPGTAGAWSARLRELTADAEALTMLAQSLGGDSREAALAWVKAAQTTIGGHRRDLEALAPWAEPLDALAADLPEEMLVGREAVGRLRSETPALGDLAACTEAAARELTALVAEGVPPGVDAVLDAGRVGKVIEALERSGLAAAALAHR